MLGFLVLFLAETCTSVGTRFGSTWLKHVPVGCDPFPDRIQFSLAPCQDAGTQYAKPCYLPPLPIWPRTLRCITGYRTSRSTELLVGSMSSRSRNVNRWSAASGRSKRHPESSVVVAQSVVDTVWAAFLDASSLLHDHVAYANHAPPRSFWSEPCDPFLFCTLFRVLPV